MHLPTLRDPRAVIAPGVRPFTVYGPPWITISLILSCFVAPGFKKECWTITFTAATNMNVFPGILMISVNDRVCESFTQCDLNVALALRNTAAVPEQEHESIHEGRDRSHFAWQRALQFDTRTGLIMGYSHSKSPIAFHRIGYLKWIWLRSIDTSIGSGTFWRVSS